MKPLTEMDPNRLQDHVLSTYITLRAGIAIITLALPLVIFLAGMFSGVELQGSISAYYWADELEPNVPRTVFIGGIFAVASGLYLYKVFTAAENIALNLAAVLATLVALVPMSHGDWNPGYWHGSFAIAMFVLLVYVVWFSSATRNAAQGKIAISPASAEREHRTPFPSGVPE